MRGVAAAAVAAAAALAWAVGSAAGAPAVNRMLETLAMSTTASGFGLIEDQGAARCVDYVGSTSDGGAHFGSLARLASWRCASYGRCTELGMAQCARNPLIDGYLGEVDATSAATFYVIGIRSPLLVTHDGGASWTALQSVGDVNGSPAQVIFFGARDGVVLGRLNDATASVAIWHTSDGGASWSALTPCYGS